MAEGTRPRFADIPQLPRAFYEVDVGWDYLEEHLDRYRESYRLDLEPEFQRAHVWTRGQQIAYVEYMLRGGEVGKSLTFNHPSWNRNVPDSGHRMVIVDGKQRLEAVRSFLRDGFPAFGHLFSEYSDQLRFTVSSFKFRVCSLGTDREILDLYLNINAGGTPHTEEELDRVRRMRAELEVPPA